MTVDVIIEFTAHRPPGVREIIATGFDCCVGRIDDKTVLKYLHDRPDRSEAQANLDVEAQIYTILGSHDRIVRFKGGDAIHGLRLEYAVNGSVAQYLKLHNPTTLQKLIWSQQAAEGIAYLHGLAVLHCDINTNSILLDHDLNVKLVDFQGRFLSQDGKVRLDGTHVVVEDPPGQELGSPVNDGTTDSIRHWIQEEKWPRALFERDDEEMHALTRKRSTPSVVNYNPSESTPVSFREGKNPAFRSQRYEMTLASVGIQMAGPEQPTDTAKTLCRTLLARHQPPPQDSIFRDDRFEAACENLRNRNKAKVIQDIARLIVPSPENLTLYGADLGHLAETVNESWIKSIPLVDGPRPLPDFAVGFRARAFTAAQLKKLTPYIGDWRTSSRLVATDEMYFPFLTSEVKCGNEGLDIADRENSHSASVAMNAIIELYRAVSRQSELHREILAYSVSHDHRAVRIYGHYALINEKDTTFHRHLIKSFDFMSEDGTEKWTAYQFTRNVYDTFAPTLHDRICDAIDQLQGPEALVESSQQSDVDVELHESQSTPLRSQGSVSGLPSS